jgi:predicted glycosyltransferase involved in capsule biosynthesis
MRPFNRGGQGRGRGISILVPFRAKSEYRQQVWHWLEEHYRNELPEAQIIVSGDDGLDPFCKTMAFNNAFEKATGDIIVLLDADCLINKNVILTAARKIRRARKMGRKTWFVPYRKFYRMSENFTDAMLRTQPTHPIHIPNPPLPWMLDLNDPITEKSSSCGHWFGALIQIVPREAYELVGGMDERFSSWGGEDVSFMRLLDTLYARHHTLNNPVYHMWHPKHGKYYTERFWDGGKPQSNDWLANKYTRAYMDPAAMRRLISERGYHSRKRSK